MAAEDPVAVPPRVRCAACGVTATVYPAMIFAGMPQEQRRQAIAALSVFRDESGDRYSVADSDERYSCPACGQPGRVPAIG